MIGDLRHLAGRLRDETAELHKATESIVGVPDWVETRAQYARLLQLLATFYSSTQLAMEDARWAEDWRRVDIDIASYSRVGLVRSDLSELGSDIEDGPPSAFPIETFGFALGCLYVVEGSSLGGLFIGPAIRQAIGAVPTSFYDGVGREHPRPWRRVRAALAAHEADHADVEDVILGAKATFVRFGEVARAERWAATRGD